MVIGVKMAGDGTNEMSARHWYLCADCLNPECDATQVLRHIGPESGWPQGPKDLPVFLPSPFEIRCPTCRQTHEYKVKNIRPMLLEQGPPPGFQSLI